MAEPNSTPDHRPKSRSILLARGSLGLLAVAALVLAAGAGRGPAQEKEPVFDKVKGHVLRPGVVEATDERVNQLKLPAGFRIHKFAAGLKNPRMLAVADDGTVYVTQREPGLVTLLRDTDGDGKADVQKVVLREPHVHGIVLYKDKVYLATVTEVFVADRKSDGTFGEPKKIMTGLPPGGQHPNRTLAVGPDDRLYVTIGSLNNASPTPVADRTATIQVAGLDGQGMKTFAAGLRNTIGFGWHPKTKEMWGMDHGIDWLGDDIPPEELNRLEEGRHYGWPYFWGNNQRTPSVELPKDKKDLGKGGEPTPPVLTYQAHSAPLQMAFYTGTQFPEEYRNDAFVAMRGSWNRQPPSGYEVVRIRFDEAGKPQKIEPFLTGFLIRSGDKEYHHFARLAGLAVAKDGSLLVGDDTNGVIYRVSYQAGRK